MYFISMYIRNPKILLPQIANVFSIFMYVFLTLFILTKPKLGTQISISVCHMGVREPRSHPLLLPWRALAGSVIIGQFSRCEEGGLMMHKQ